ncbi:UNVERIFIED_CONTAM: hypothetical protein K2H54_001029 [Gekko kuhli]
MGGTRVNWGSTCTLNQIKYLRDLLGKVPQEKLDIKLCPDGSGQLYVPGMTEFPVHCLEDINKVFEFEHINRATECTYLNEHSSRSHALLIVAVRGVNYSTGIQTTGKLNLVDLAGSERVGKSGAEGNRLREAQYINKSLLALGDVIYALRSRQGHVPFRNSKLTYLLQDSLSGDSKTLMMVHGREAGAPVFALILIEVIIFQIHLLLSWSTRVSWLWIWPHGAGLSCYISRAPANPHCPCGDPWSTRRFQLSTPDGSAPTGSIVPETPKGTLDMTEESQSDDIAGAVLAEDCSTGVISGKSMAT